VRPAESVLHRILLVEHHPDEERERAVGEDLVGVGFAGDVDGHGVHLDPSPGQDSSATAVTPT
jgi:hypothetical protein